MNKRRLLKTIAEIFRILLGITFTFSGFVKAVDPYGTALKIGDYIFAFHLDFLSFFSMSMSFFLCGFEFVMGVLMLLGIYRKWTSRLMLLTMLFMTMLTLYLAIANPVSDCGCFGDVLILTNWETFFKNIFLLAFTVFLFFNYKYLTPVFGVRYEKFSFAYIVIFTFILLFISYRYDSVADFRPYHTGANLLEKMTVDEDKKPVEEILFIYEKNGERKEFSKENYPWQDSIWKFVDRITKVIKQGEQPEISDFSIDQYVFDNDFGKIIDEVDITDNVLQDDNYSFLMIAPFLTELEEKEIMKFNDISEYVSEYGYSFFCLTSSLYEEIIVAKSETFPQIDFCAVDEKVLKTIVRANPSLVLLKNGTIIHKWSKPQIPLKKELIKPLEQLEFSIIEEASHTNTCHILICLFILSIPILGIKIIEFIQNKRIINN